MEWLRCIGQWFRAAVVAAAGAGAGVVPRVLVVGGGGRAEGGGQSGGAGGGEADPVVQEPARVGGRHGARDAFGQAARLQRPQSGDEDRFAVVADVLPAQSAGGLDVPAGDLPQRGVLCGGQRDAGGIGGAPAADRFGEGRGAAHGGLGGQGGERSRRGVRVVCGGAAEEGELLEADLRARQIVTCGQPFAGHGSERGAGRGGELLCGGGMGVGPGRRSGAQEAVERVVVLHVLVREEQQRFDRCRLGGHVEHEGAGGRGRHARRRTARVDKGASHRRRVMWSLPWPVRGREGVSHPARGGRWAIRCQPAPRRDAPLSPSCV